jgi:hypothetical protein
VEAGNVPGRILIRDTTQRGNGPVMSVTPQSWRQFTAGIRDGAPIS